MNFPELKPSVMPIGILSIILLGCTPPNYAPVRVVNQPIKPDNDYIGDNSGDDSETRQASLKSRDQAEQNTTATQSGTQGIVHKEAPSNRQKKERRSQSRAALSPEPQGVRVNQPEAFEKNKQNGRLADKAHISEKAMANTKPNLQSTVKKKKFAPDEVASASLAEKNKPSLTSGQQAIAQASDKSAPSRKNAEERKASISINNKKMLKLNFDWPIWGKIARNFNQTDSKGIDIAGKPGDPVHASESGKAVYCGQGLAGFGNLIIIKHNEAFLTAYARNSELHVKEGQQVKKGQAIGRLGSPGSKKALLHFEIRKNGKPVNPLTLLPRR